MGGAKIEIRNYLLIQNKIPRNARVSLQRDRTNVLCMAELEEGTPTKSFHRLTEPETSESICLQYDSEILYSQNRRLFVSNTEKTKSCLNLEVIVGHAFAREDVPKLYCILD